MKNRGTRKEKKKKGIDLKERRRGKREIELVIKIKL